MNLKPITALLLLRKESILNALDSENPAAEKELKCIYTNPANSAASSSIKTSGFTDSKYS